MERWLRECRQGLQRLGRAPLYSGTVLLVVATSVAVAASMASLAGAVRRQAVPYPDADRLVLISEFHRQQNITGMQSSLPSVQVWREAGTMLENFGIAHAPVNLTLQTREGATRLLGGIASPELLGTLQVRPTLGRAFRQDEGNIGSTSSSVILSHRSWMRVFGGDPAIVGRTLRINGRPWEVIGVLPPATPLLPTSAEAIEVWFPLGQAPALLGRDVSNDTKFRAFYMIGRLRADAGPERVADELKVVGGVLADRFPASSTGWEWAARPLSEVVTQNLSGPMMAMTLSAALLLVVGVVNVLGLFVQRAARTVRWAIVSVALGATHRDLCRQASIESGMLWVAGAAIGVGLAGVGIRLRDSWLPFPLPPHLTVGLQPLPALGAIGLALLMTVITGVIVGSWWWRQAQVAPVETGRAIASPLSGLAVRLGLAMQVGLGAVLTVTGLLAHSSSVNLERADVGFESDRLLTLRVDVTEERSAAQVHPTADAILAELQAVPGVEHASFWAPHVPAQAVWFTAVRVFDRPDLREEETMPVVRIHQVAAGAPTLLGLRFVAGRDLSEADEQSGRRVALVSESAAREWWGGQPAVGRRIQRWNQDEWSTVVGVVADAPMSGRRGEGSDFVRDVFLLHEQDPQRPLVFLLRTRGDPTAIVASARDAVRKVAADLPLYAIRPMADILREQELTARSTARLGSGYALLALVLLAVGLYGIIANVTAERAVEISVRKALGATTPRILRDVTVPTVGVFVVGAGLGLAAAWRVLPRFIETMLFEVGADEPAAYVAAFAVLSVAVVPAVFGPALRAASQSPAGVLRHGR